MGAWAFFFAQQGHSGSQLFFAEILGAAEDDGTGVLNLVVEKLTESLHLLACLKCIYHCNKCIKLDRLLFFDIYNRFHDI